MLRREHSAAIEGDVTAAEDVTINKKGGSLTAILKKSLREQLGAVEEPLMGAALQFDTGQSVVVLSRKPGTAAGGATVQVRKVGPNRFQLSLGDESAQEVDPVTAAFVQLKIDLFAKGKLQLSDPYTAESWGAVMDRRLAPAKAARTALQRRRRAS